MRKINLLLVSLILLIVIKLNAQTYVSGTLFKDAVWTSDKSPYIIEEDLGIYTNVTLTLKEGVVVKCAKDKGIVVKGSIIAEGTQEKPVVFSGLNEEGFGAWLGITISTDENSVVSFKYAQFLGPDIAFDQRTSGGMSKKYFKNCQFMFSNYGMYNVRNVEIDSCRFLNMGSSLRYGTGKISHSDFKNNTETAIGNFTGDITLCRFSENYEALHSEFILKVSECEFYGNELAISFSNNLTLTHSEIYDNKSGIWGGGTSVTIKHNKICNNTEFNFRLGPNDLDLTDNCWCLTDSAEIKKTIYDKYQNVNIGFAHYVPFNNCMLTDTVIVPKDTIKISGSVYAGEYKISEGVVFLYDENNMFPVAYTTIIDGNYIFENVSEGRYKVYAIAEHAIYRNYLPTYYVNRISYDQAYTFTADTDVSSVDIHLANISNVPGNINYNGNIVFQEFQSQETWYESPWLKPAGTKTVEGNNPGKLTVLLHNADGQIIDWTLTDGTGNFSFYVPSPDCYITVERKGYILNGNGSVKSGSHLLARSSVLNGISDNAFRNTSLLRIWPNPSNDFITIEFNQKNNLNSAVIEILSQSGELKYAASSIHSDSKIDVSDFAAGFYMVRIISEDAVITDYFIKN